MAILDHKELRVYREAFLLAVEVYRLTSSFPADERFRLTDQIIRSSRSPCASIAEAWRKRQYKLQFVNKIADAEQEISETRVWLEFAQAHGFIPLQVYSPLNRRYQTLLTRLSNTRRSSKHWCQFRPEPDHKPRKRQ